MTSIDFGLLAFSIVASLSLASLELTTLTLISLATSEALRRGWTRPVPARTVSNARLHIAYAISKHHNGFFGITLLAYSIVVCLSRMTTVLQPGGRLMWTTLLFISCAALTGVCIWSIFILRAEVIGHAKSTMVGGRFAHNYLHRERFRVGCVGFAIFVPIFYFHINTR